MTGRVREVAPLAGDDTGDARVADLVRDSILAGELQPGERLVEADLSGRYGASRSTVRAALMELAHEGLVERLPNRGARVREVSLAEAIAITEVRLAVEALCAAKAAERVTDAEILQLHELGERMKAAVEADDVDTYSALNQTLHSRIREISDQPVAAQVLRRLRAQNVRHQFALARRPGRPRVSLPEHLAIIDEVCARSPGGAERAVRRHITSVLDELRRTDSLPAETEV